MIAAIAFRSDFSPKVPGHAADSSARRRPDDTEAHTYSCTYVQMVM